MNKTPYHLIENYYRVQNIINACLSFFKKNNAGCYVTILDSSTSEVILSLAFGFIPLNKSKNCFYQSIINGQKFIKEFKKRKKIMGNGVAYGGCFVWSIRGLNINEDTAISSILAKEFYLGTQSKKEKISEPDFLLANSLSKFLLANDSIKKL